MNQKRIFFVGISSTGKTPMIEAIRLRLEQKGIIHKIVYAGGWVRDCIKPIKGLSKDQLSLFDKTDMASKTVELLRNGGANLPIAWIEEQCGDNPLVLIDGVRNPDDYAVLWRPGDVTIFFSRSGHSLPQETWPFKTKGLDPRSDFEKWGVLAVAAYADFRQFLHPQSKLLQICIPALTLFQEEHYEEVYKAIVE